MASGEEYTWVAHPDVVSKAIYILSATVVVFGGVIVKIALFIDKNRMKMLQSVANDVKKIADDFQNYTLKGEHRITMIETRVNRIEEDTQEIRRLCEDRRQRFPH